MAADHSAVGARLRVRLLAFGAATLVAAALACALPARSGAASIPPLPRPFAPDSFWNAPLPATAPLDPSSPALVGELVRQVQTFVPWINTTSFSEPVYVVGPGQATETVHLDHGGWWAGTHADALTLQQQFAAVPVPAGARPAGGTDRVLIVWQPSSDTMWELLGARHVPDDLDPWSLTPGWHAEWGARIDHVSTSSGVLPYPFGASSSGLALAGGLISAAELEQGQIDHAVALGIPQVMKGVPAFPANRTDGTDLAPGAIREGQRFRLDASLNIAALGLPPITRAIAYAAQRYGIVVRDVSGAVSFYAQDPRSIGFNPYPSLFGGIGPDKLLARFPWDQLMAVASGPDGVAPPTVGPLTAADPVAPVATLPTMSVPKTKPHTRRSHKRTHRKRASHRSRAHRRAGAHRRARHRR